MKLTAILVAAMMTVAGAIVAAIVLFASDEDAPDAAVLPPEQDDYLYRAAEVISVMNRGDAASDFPLYYAEPDEIGPVEELETATAKWDALGPPEELATEHRNMSRLFHRMLPAYAPGADQDAILELGSEPYNEWLEAIVDHYLLGILVYRSAPFMEPTFCFDDAIVFELSDRQLDRWQLAFVRQIRDELTDTPDFLLDGRGDVLRVAGLPGETIEVTPDGVLINGVFDASYAATRAQESYGPVQIPRDSYFLLADDRGKAIDSRNNRIPGDPTFYRDWQITGELPADAHGCMFNKPSKN